MKKINHTSKKNLIAYSLVLLTIIISVFALTKYGNTYSSEMYFTEKANSPKILGSVMPASCSSDPKINNNDGNWGGCNCNPSTEEWVPQTAYWCPSVGGWTFSNSCGTGMTQISLVCKPRAVQPKPYVNIWFN